MSKKDKEKRKKHLAQAKKRRRAPEPLAQPVSRHEQKSCLEKVPYASRAEANLVSESWGKTVVPYLCEYCDNWHLTSAS